VQICTFEFERLQRSLEQSDKQTARADTGIRKRHI